MCEFYVLSIFVLERLTTCMLFRSVRFETFLQSFKTLWFRVTPLDVLTFCLFRKWGQERNKNCWEEEEGCSLVYLLTSSMYVLEIDKFCNIASTSMCFSLVFKVSTNSVCLSYYLVGPDRAQFFQASSLDFRAVSSLGPGRAQARFWDSSFKP